MTIKSAASSGTPKFYFILKRSKRDLNQNGRCVVGTLFISRKPAWMAREIRLLSLQNMTIFITWARSRTKDFS